MLDRGLLLALLLVLAATGLAAQQPQPAKDPAPAKDDKPAQDTKPDDAPLFRWRVGASVGVSYGALLADPKADRSMPEEGIVGEFSLSGRVTHRDSGLSANFGVCWGCHGIELEQATLEWKPVPLLMVKAGRLNVAASTHDSRHGFNTRATISKPLTRSMGNMVRQQEFNLGVLPSPYIDNGASVGLNLDMGIAGMTLEAMVLKGFKGTGEDIDFLKSREYFDNNGEPGFGARLEFSVPLLTLNFAYLWGNYDTEARRSYQFASANLRLVLGPVTLEGEFAWRQTQYTRAGSPGGEDQWWKYGWWAQVDWQVFDGLHLTGVLDALYVKDIYLADFGPTSNAAVALTDNNNRIVRAILGVSYTAWGGVLIRLNAEFWDFSDFNDAWVIQGGLGWAF